ncbi:hypothetical protein L596_014370 [Steinernema carpocapsae]|uniref:Uncharacterized protein n=1 Tax=Steinernema carpocapsae TaxID=34508 RepID=A0A4U5NCT8_STECR|nr:hypothetical protein L596_014370 [Steinernema carpocapsae]
MYFVERIRDIVQNGISQILWSSIFGSSRIPSTSPKCPDISDLHLTKSRFFFVTQCAHSRHQIFQVLYLSRFLCHLPLKLYSKVDFRCRLLQLSKQTKEATHGHIAALCHFK